MVTTVLWAVLLASGSETLSLAQALALADERHVDEQLAATELAVAERDSQASYQFILPRIDLVAQATRQYYAPQTAITMVPGTTSDGDVAFVSRRVDLPGYQRPDYNLGVRITQPLYDGGRWWHAIAKGESDLRAAQARHAEAVLQTHVSVAHLFFEWVRADRSLAVLSVNEERSSEQLGRAVALFDAARGTKSDVLSAQVNLANDRMAKTQQAQRVDLARAALNVALGFPADQAWTPSPPEFRERPVAPDSALAEAEALRRRPGLLALEQVQQASASAVGMSKANFLPVLSAQGSYLRASPDAGLVFGDPSRQYVATGTLNLTWNVFAGRTDDVAAAKAELAAQAASLQFEKSRRAVREEVFRALRQIEAGLRALDWAEQAHAAAQEGLALADERYRVGIGSGLEARDAQLKLTSAELALVSTRIDLQLAEIDLRAATGAY